MNRRLLVFVLVLASCAVDATRPLTPAASAKADPALVGTWRSNEKKAMTFVVSAKGAQVHIDIEGEKKPMAFEGHVSVLAPDLKVLNLREVSGETPSTTWLFVRYAVKADGSLDTWLVNETLASEALNAGTLTGHRGQYGGVTLEDTPEKMVAFLSRGSREATFTPLMTLKRASKP